MRSARVQSVDWLGEMPNQDAGSEPVLRVEVDLPAGSINAFYMDTADIHKVPIKVPLANQPKDAPIDPRAINAGDRIDFDIPSGLLGLEREVHWNGRRIPQRGFSFDWTVSSDQGQSF